MGGSNLLDLIQNLSNKNKNIIFNFYLNEANEPILNVLEDFSNIINGFNIFIKFEHPKQLKNFLYFVSRLEKNYILVSRNSIQSAKEKFEIVSPYYKGAIYNAIFSFTFINKKLVDNYSIPIQQDTNKLFVGENILWYTTSTPMPRTSIHYAITVVEKIKKELLKQQ